MSILKTFAGLLLLCATTTHAQVSVTYIDFIDFSDEIEFTGVTDPIQTPIATKTDFSEVLSVSQFDASLGTLVNVEVDLTLFGQQAGRGVSTNEPAGNTTLITFDFTLDVIATDMFGVQLLAIDEDTSLSDTSVNTPDFLTSISLFAAGMASDPAVAVVSTQVFQESTLYTPANQSLFIGAGTYDITVDADATSVIADGGNVLNAAATVAGAQLTVTYFYAPEGVIIPEPKTFGLLLCLFMGGWILFRRSRRG